jgi:hypothetical protein
LQCMGLLVVTLKAIAIRACLLRELIVCWNVMCVHVVYHFWLSKSHGWVDRWTPYSVTICFLSIVTCQGMYLQHHTCLHVGSFDGLGSSRFEDANALQHPQ